MYEMERDRMRVCVRERERERARERERERERGEDMQSDEKKDHGQRRGEAVRTQTNSTLG